MSTNVLSAKDIKREWHLIDAKGKILGRLATEVATILQGKKKAAFVPYLDTGDRKSTRLNSSHQIISYAVFCLKKKISPTRRPASARNPARAPRRTRKGN